MISSLSKPNRNFASDHCQNEHVDSEKVIRYLNQWLSLSEEERKQYLRETEHEWNNQAEEDFKKLLGEKPPEKPA